MPQPLMLMKLKVLYEDLHDLLELTHTHTQNVLFIIGVWTVKVRSQAIPGVIGKFGYEAGPKLTKFCQEKTLIIANTPFQQHKR